MTLIRPKTRYLAGSGRPAYRRGVSHPRPSKRLNSRKHRYRTLARAAGMAAVMLLTPLLAQPAHALRAQPGKVKEDKAKPPSKGRPKTVLNRLAFPPLLGGTAFKKHLARTLKREARRADWGVGRGHKIEYRVNVSKLTVRQEGRTLHVHCQASGKLPKARAVSSQLSFGGDARNRSKVVKHVLDIVARGLIARLAEMERVRRGRLRRVRVRAPSAS